MLSSKKSRGPPPNLFSQAFYVTMIRWKYGPQSTGQDAPQIVREYRKGRLHFTCAQVRIEHLDAPTTVIPLARIESYRIVQGSGIRLRLRHITETAVDSALTTVELGFDDKREASSACRVLDETHKVYRARTVGVLMNPAALDESP